MILGLDSTDEDTVERAVEHICFLADVNRIYEAALGMYELSLALLIAQQSQKVFVNENLELQHSLIK